MRTLTRRHILALTGGVLGGLATSQWACSGAGDGDAVDPLKRRDSGPDGAPGPNVERSATAPNIILITTDQEHPLRWGDVANAEKELPARAWLKQHGVFFSRAYTNTVACSPSRCSLYTGMHPYQMHTYGNTGMDGSYLNDFPTMARILREKYGYQTYYIGKSHLASTSTTPCSRDAIECGMEPYGFDKWVTANLPPVNVLNGGELRWPENTKCYDSPGIPNEGTLEDHHFVEYAVKWLKAVAGQDMGAPFNTAKPETGRPWFTVFSLVNPHDIAFFPRLATRYVHPDTKAMIPSSDAPAHPAFPPANRSFTLQTRAGNFEPGSLLAKYKPTCHENFQAFTNLAIGTMPTEYGSTVEELLPFDEMVTYYHELLKYSDDSLVAILQQVLALPKDVRDRTILIVTADHGEMLGAHGLRGKGCNNYEEQMNVPLFVVDFSHPSLKALPFGADGALPNAPTNETGGTYVKTLGAVRTELVSLHDVTSTIVTLGADKRQNWEAWRAFPAFSIDNVASSVACSGTASVGAAKSVLVTAAHLHGQSLLPLLAEANPEFGAVAELRDTGGATGPALPAGKKIRYILTSSSSNWIGPTIKEPYHLVGLREQVFAGGVLESDYKLTLYYRWRENSLGGDVLDAGGRRDGGRLDAGVSSGPFGAKWDTASTGHGPVVDWDRPEQVELYDMLHSYSDAAGSAAPFDPNLCEVNNLLPVAVPEQAADVAAWKYGSKKWLKSEPRTGQDGKVRAFVVETSQTFSQAEQEKYVAVYAEMKPRLVWLAKNKLNEVLRDASGNPVLLDVQRAGWDVYNGEKGECSDTMIEGIQTYCNF